MNFPAYSYPVQRVSESCVEANVQRHLPRITCTNNDVKIPTALREVTRYTETNGCSFVRHLVRNLSTRNVFNARQFNAMVTRNFVISQI
jgi:hypothetical protein